MMKYLYTVIAVVTIYANGALDAQVLFQRPDTTPDYSAYTHPEECLSAMERVNTEVRNRDTVWRDTMLFDMSEYFRPLNSEAIEIGQTCLRHTPLDSITFHDAKIWLRTLLAAGRDKDAESMYTRLIGSIEDKDTNGHIIELMSVYYKIVPLRSADILNLYKHALEKVPSDSFDHMMVATYYALDALRKTSDTVNTQLLLQEAMAVVDTLPESVRQKNTYKLAAWGLFIALQETTIDEGMDSLAISASAYEAYLKNIWSSLSDDPLPTLSLVVGKKSPALEGDFWYAGQSGSFEKIDPQVRPVPGRVNAIVFIDGNCHTTTPFRENGRPFSKTHCWPDFSSLKRLKVSYPDLEITLVSKTLGNVGNAPPLDPADEADTLANYFLGFHGITAVHVISETEYFRIAGLDQRKIDAETVNETNYTIEGLPLGRPGSILLVDQSGTIFHSGSIAREEEQRVSRKIEAVMRRVQ